MILRHRVTLRHFQGLRVKKKAPPPRVGVPFLRAGMFSRAVSAQNRCFWSIPERFQHRVGVSGAFPNGFSIESVFLEHSRVVSV